MPLANTRPPKFSAKQIKNIRKLRSIVEIADTEKSDQRHWAPILKRVTNLGFHVPQEDLLAQAEEDHPVLGEFSLLGRPVEAMIADLRSCERAIRKGNQPCRLPVGLVRNSEEHPQRKLKALTVVHDQPRKVLCRATVTPTKPAAAQILWDPEETEKLCQRHLDRRIRSSEMGWESLWPKNAETEFILVFREALPYDAPSLTDWKDGILLDLAPRVMVIREVSVTRDSPAISSLRCLSPHRFIPPPVTCSSRIPPGMNAKEMAQNYVSLRAFDPGERKLALTCEIYFDGKLDGPARRVLVTHGNLRSTVRFAVRDRAWHDARHGRANSQLAGKADRCKTHTRRLPDSQRKRTASHRRALR